MRLIFILIILAFMCSCSMNKEQEIAEAKDLIHALVGEGKCQDAVDVAEGIGRQNDDPVFMQIHASAYMCRAGVSTLSFVKNDIEKIDTGATEFMGSLTTFTTSNDTVPDADSYQDLRTALDILLTPASGQPSQLARNSKFGTNKAGDVGVQALIISLVQFGKFLKLYGNTDSAGDKGQGPNVNQCFISYTYNQAQLYLNGTTNGGACNDIATDLGSPHLAFTAGATLTRTKRRMCEGLMLVTNILDIVNAVDLSENESMYKFNDVVEVVNDQRDYVISTNPQLETLLSTTSQSACEEEVKSTTGFDDLQFVYALLFERGLP